jgi:predicted metal-binding membrane protein
VIAARPNGRPVAVPALFAAAGVAWLALVALHATGHAGDVSATLALWSLMVAAMMLPTAAPMVRAFADVVAAGRGRVAPTTTAAFVAGYVIVWLGFAIAAASAQLALADTGLLTSSGGSTSLVLTAALLLAAGAYQLTPLKAGCASRCRTPMAFLLARWRDGHAGALALGLRHGVDCVGCCWALMALGFVSGVMDPAWMTIAMVLMGVEKLPAVGQRVTVPLGGALLGAGLITALLAIV